MQSLQVRFAYVWGLCFVLALSAVACGAGEMEDDDSPSLDMSDDDDSSGDDDDDFYYGDDDDDVADYGDPSGPVPLGPGLNGQGDPPPPPSMVFPGTEDYAEITDNPFLDADLDPVSTFSIDVDTGSYSNMRRFIQQGHLPPADAVRIEELINYFNYEYEVPTDGTPFSVRVDTAEAPWSPQHRLAKIGLKGREISAANRPPANLVFLVDVSGSMSSRMHLVKSALRLLVPQLDQRDKVAMAVYAGNSGLALGATYGDDHDLILDAINRLESGGSTNGGAGIRLAYNVARENFMQQWTNRVILITDGDFNVGVTNQNELMELIEEEAASGVFLTAIGVGMGNYKDDTIEQLADRGNGFYAYLDSQAEAEKLFVEEFMGTIVTIAKDVKIQVEFNPDLVDSYRLIGYENRIMPDQDFDDDTKDAGEIGAGHTVTALYEIVPAAGIDPQQPIFNLALRYKEPDADQSKLLEYPIFDPGTLLEESNGDFRFAAGVAAFGMILRDSPYRGVADIPMVLGLAEAGLGQDPNGHRAQFVGLAQQAGTLLGREAQPPATDCGNGGASVDRTYAVMCLLDGDVSQPAGLGPVLKGLISCDDIPPVGLTIHCALNGGDTLIVAGATLDGQLNYDPQTSVRIPMPPADFSNNPLMILQAEGEIEIEVEGIVLRISDLELTGVLAYDLSAITDAAFSGLIDPAPLEEILGSPPCNLIPGICDGNGYINLFVENLEAIAVDTTIPLTQPQ